ncbi:MAG: 5-formyltetrahydrofolate cyclo-ligase [Vicingus serpentipes]|nr:5-formyltetrahydrofolate cyclo-ligase [Vicingus serpentipes]
MTEIIKQKKDLRKEMLIKRAKLDKIYKKKYDLWVCNELENIIDANNYKIIHAYLPMGKEIDITPLLKKLLSKNITVVTPKTLPKRKLENRVLTSLTDIEKGVFGTTHPVTPEEYKGVFDLIIVPGLAFDNDNYRLGYGGGYYDNFLVHHPDSNKIGIFYPEQEVEKVPVETHDIRLDNILLNSNLG